MELTQNIKKSIQNVYRIERLSTKSTVYPGLIPNKHSTEWLWFYGSFSENKWTLFDDNHDLVRSHIIERLYAENEFDEDSPLEIHDFKISIPNMTLKIGAKKYDILRRPLHKPRQLENEPVSSESLIEKCLPRHWSKMDLRSGFKLIDLSPNDSGFKKIDFEFRSSMTNVDIRVKKIQRIQNPTLYAHFYQ